MQVHKEQWSIEEMAKTLEVSRSGYYRFIKAKVSEREKESLALLSKIRLIHKESRETYGSPRIHAQLQEEGETCSRKRVAKIMKSSGLKAKMNKRFKITTRTNPKAIAAPNLLQQQFKAQKPNEKWVADLTYVATEEGWLYVATVLDLFSRRIVGLAMGERMTADLVSQALQQALIHRKPPANLLHHSDKGSQYTSSQFLTLLRANNIIPSMSGSGNCFDNAAMESFYHTLKTEHVYFESYKSRKEAKQSIFEYVEVFYNRKRKHSTLGYCTPIGFEENWRKQKNLSLVLLSTKRLQDHFHHYHSNTHEVLVIIAGECQVQFGGDNGSIYTVHQDDVVILPAGVAHKSVSMSDNFRCIGAYPFEVGYDMNYGNSEEYSQALETIKNVGLPKKDPIFGEEGLLFNYWK